MKKLLILTTLLICASCGVEGELINPRTGEPVQTEGRDGERGEDGTDGVDGERGSNGTDGSRGPSGNDGAAGVEGPSGTDGQAGSDGSPAPVTTYICTIDTSRRKDRYYITIQVVGSADTTFEVKECS